MIKSVFLTTSPVYAHIEGELEFIKSEFRPEGCEELNWFVIWSTREKFWFKGTGKLLGVYPNNLDMNHHAELYGQGLKLQ